MGFPLKMMENTQTWEFLLKLPPHEAQEVEKLCEKWPQSVLWKVVPIWHEALQEIRCFKT